MFALHYLLTTCDTETHTQSQACIILLKKNIHRAEAKKIFSNHSTISYFDNTKNLFIDHMHERSIDFSFVVNWKSHLVDRINELLILEFCFRFISTYRKCCVSCFMEENSIDLIVNQTLISLPFYKHFSMYEAL